MKNSYIFLIAVLISLAILTFSGNRNVFLGETVNRGYSGLYFLDEYGNLYVSGAAKNLGNLRFGEKIARDLELTNDGYYVLDKYGNVYAFGDARKYGEARIDNAIDLELTDNGYYILDSSGVVYSFGDAGKHGDGKGNYVDMELTDNGYYLLNENGKVDIFGDAVFYGDIEGEAADLELSDNGYFILEKNGKINVFGDAEDRGYENIKNARDLELVERSKGYYILDGHGLAYSYLANAGFPGPEYSEENKYVDMEILKS